jgi:hypothetical protein
MFPFLFLRPIKRAFSRLHFAGFSVGSGDPERKVKKRKIPIFEVMGCSFASSVPVDKDAIKACSS